MANELHDKVLDFAESYRKDHPDFRYALRKANRKNRLEEGSWFQGREDYAFLGLINRSGGISMTKSLGLVFFPSGDDVKCNFRIVIDKEKDQRVIDFYNKFIEQIGDVEIVKQNIKYRKELATENGFLAAQRFLDTNLPKMNALIKEMGLDFLLITAADFMDNLNKINEYKSNASLTNNYWIFQGNPKIFDLAGAIQSGSLNNWTVTAHRDKIKPGDKVILWMTGPKAGCYALAEVKSIPYERTSSQDDSYYMTEMKGDWQVDIQITHDLHLNPLLSNELKAIDTLSSIKAGHQGTNFTATKAEFDAIKQLILLNGSTDVRYWLYSPGERAYMWDEFFALGKMGVDWELEDLSAYSDKEQLRVDLRKLYKTDNSKKNDVTACWEFSNTINKNDIVIAKKGTSEYIGWGIVTSDYYYDPSQPKFKHFRNVKWVSKGSWPDANIVPKTLTDITKYPDYVSRLINLIGIRDPSFEKLSNLNMSHPLNTILFGPPGTGKTYNTINHAVSIIENKSIDTLNKEDRTEIKIRFDRYSNEGRIRFITFHQSLSYEDFIEGIKPVEPEKEGDPVIYRIEYGLLKKICIEAAFAIAQERDSSATESVLDFSILYDSFIENIEEQLLNGKKVELSTKSGGSVLVESISQPGNVIIKHHEGTRSYTVSKTRLTKLHSSFPDLNDISNINDEFRDIIGGSNSSAYWSVLNAIRKQKPVKTKQKSDRTYTWDEKREVVSNLKKEDYKTTSMHPYVLIIDEINRGNVSQIFGELITLIEPDKRLGGKEALETTLPYSKESFGVPSNLYIIGTMNTADRSVEALDTALRRRFTFEEMPPRYDLKELNRMAGNYFLKDILQRINIRLEKLLDKDHMIGHSYFIFPQDSDTTSALMESFYKNIIPLLQEYFFGDYGKIGLVLGQGFVSIKDQMEKIFCAFDYDGADMLLEKPIYTIVDYRKPSSNLTDGVTFSLAIDTLMDNRI